MYLVGIIFASIGNVLGWVEVIRYSQGHPRNWGFLISGLVLALLGIILMCSVLISGGMR